MRPLILAALLLAACTPPPEIIVQAPPPPAPPPEPAAPVIEPDPVPTPAPGHVWILDAADTLLYDCEQGDWDGAYSQLLRGVQLTCESHNMEFPADPWHYVAGGPA